MYRYKVSFEARIHRITIIKTPHSSGAVSRAQFLQGAWRGVQAIRPPWALPEADFIRQCDSCGKCVAVCETHILKSARGRYPAVDFAKGECTFCKACLNVCPTSALSEREGEGVWPYKAEINDKCLSIQGVMCRACGDACESRAIQYRLMVGGFSKPEITQHDCTACGACLVPCPVDAIEIKNPNLVQAQT